MCTNSIDWLGLGRVFAYMRYAAGEMRIDSNIAVSSDVRRNDVCHFYYAVTGNTYQPVVLDENDCF